MSKLIWTLRQLLPLTYRTRYLTADGRSWFCVWRMWLGRPFAVEHLALADGNGGKLTWADSTGAAGPHGPACAR